MRRLVSVLASQLSLVADVHDDIWVLDGDLGDSYGVYTETGQPRFRNFVQIGIAEQTMVGAAAGLAAAQMRPWVFSFAAFLCNRAADQIRTCVIQTDLPVVLVGSHAGAATGSNGCSHSALGDIGLISALGNIEIWAPADTIDVVQAVHELTLTPRPAYIRASREPCPPLPLPPGKIRSNQIQGNSVVISTGLGSQWASDIVTTLSSQGYSIPWCHLPRINDAMIDRCLESYPELRVAVVIEDHFEIGGLGDALRRRAPRCVEVKSIGWPRFWQGESGELAELREYHKLDTQSVIKRVEHLFI